MADIYSIAPITVPYDAVRSMLLYGNRSLDQALAVNPRWNAASAAGSPVSLTYFISDAPPIYPETSNGYTNASAAAWSAGQKTIIAQVLSAYSGVANLSFTKVASQNEANMSFFLSTSITASGYGNYPKSAGEKGTAPGDVFFLTSAFPSDGSNIYLAFHEIGHALGLYHPFDTGSKPTIEDFGLNGSKRLSVVDQRPPDQPYYLTALPDGSTNIDSLFNPTGPVLLDILALQLLYGRNVTTAAGNDTYRFDVNPNFYRTIYDAGGRDTIDVSNQINPCLITLEAGTYSTIGLRDPFAGFPDRVTSWAAQQHPRAEFNEGKNSLAIAFGTVIEDAIGSSASDILLGNSVANSLRGEGGNDVLRGEAGNDTLTGGAGNDAIVGGSGTDTAVYTGTRASHTITKTSTGFTVSGGADGTDTLREIEALQFAGESIRLDKITTAGNSSDVIGAYFSMFGRAPETGGFQYWQGQLGTAFPSLGKMIDNWLSLGVVKTNGYPDGQSIDSFIAAIYQNVFNKAPDDGGYWKGQSASMSRGDLAATILGAAKGVPAGTAGKAYIDNKITGATQIVDIQHAYGKDLSPDQLTTLLKQVGASSASIQTADNNTVAMLGAAGVVGLAGVSTFTDAWVL